MEVPHIIEKEVMVEKIVKVPIIEKEFVTVPIDINLNELNKLPQFLLMENVKALLQQKHLKDWLVFVIFLNYPHKTLFPNLYHNQQ